MVERGNGARLIAETPAGLGGIQQARRQHLERDQPPQPRIPRLVDDAHAALAELFEDLVMRDRSRCHGGPQRASCLRTASAFSIALTSTVARISEVSQV